MVIVADFTPAISEQFQISKAWIVFLKYQTASLSRRPCMAMFCAQG
jgi:hypothetical protein